MKYTYIYAIVLIALMLLDACGTSHKYCYYRYPWERSEKSSLYKPKPDTLCVKDSAAFKHYSQ